MFKVVKFRKNSQQVWKLYLPYSICKTRKFIFYIIKNTLRDFKLWIIIVTFKYVEGQYYVGQKGQFIILLKIIFIKLKVERDRLTAKKAATKTKLRLNRCNLSQTKTTTSTYLSTTVTIQECIFLFLFYIEAKQFFSITYILHPLCVSFSSFSSFSLFFLFFLFSQFVFFSLYLPFFLFLLYIKA